MKESSVQQRIRLDAAYMGINLMRNNVGVLLDDKGRPVRYGLMNDSPELNRAIKSSDLIGIIPVFITPQMIGRVIGVFGAVECKESGWKPPNPHTKEYERYSAQLAFHNLVRKAGGKAGFATSVEEWRSIVIQ